MNDANRTYAVVTGDIIGFSSVSDDEKEALMASLKEAFQTIERNIPPRKANTGFNIFRGDSFQGVMEHPADALKAGLLIRSTLIHAADEKEEKWDARIAIGLGTIDFWAEQSAESDGVAYRHSGPVLDEMKGDYKIRITTPNDALNEELQASCALLDAVINKWSAAQAYIVLHLLQEESQKEIGQTLDISEAAVHYRVKSSGWFAVKAFLSRYEAIAEQLNVSD